MNVPTPVLAGAGSVLCLTAAAAAGFSGLSIVEDYRGPGGVWDDQGYGMAGLSTYRLYATFDGLGDDGILAVFGQPGDPIVIRSTDGMFHNDPLGGLTAPLDLTGVGIWQNQWDTYVTIGATEATGDATGLSPGFATATNNLESDWSNDNVGWFVTPDDAQGRADANNRVFLAQFVVNAGEVAWVTPINLLTRENEVFKGLVFPAPGALFLLGFAGLHMTGRKRNRFTPR